MTGFLDVGDRDFNTYILGDNVYELATQIIPDLAERVGVKLGNEPNSGDFHQLVKVLGPKPVLRENGEPTITIGEAAELVKESGVQRKLDRSLWTPEFKIPREVGAIVITGGMANWQDRTAKLLVGHAEGKDKPGVVYIPAGSRVMNTATEITNPHVVVFHSIRGQYPRENVYTEKFIKPTLEQAGYEVNCVPYEDKNGDEIAKSFVEENPELFDDHPRVLFAKVANAGIQLAVQFRKAAILQNRRFDNRPNWPQAFVLTDTFPVAMTEEEKNNPREFQSPYTALRQLALTAKLLHEAAGGE